MILSGTQEQLQRAQAQTRTRGTRIGLSRNEFRGARQVRSELLPAIEIFGPGYLMTVAYWAGIGEDDLKRWEDLDPDTQTVLMTAVAGSIEWVTKRNITLVLQRQFREGCGVMPGWRRGAWHGSVGPVRYCPAYPAATAATLQVRTVPGAAFPAPPGRPAAS